MSVVIDSYTSLGVKSSMCPMDDLGLLLRANGEQEVSVIDRAGNIVQAGLPEPDAALSLISVTTATTNVQVGYYGYVYVYAATEKYPLVDAGLSINGLIAPRGNPSPYLIVNASNAGGNQVNLEIPCSTRSDISEIWIFRTNVQTTSASATIDADAGLFFYIGTVANDTANPSVNFSDIVRTASLDKVEYDNFPAPQFTYAVYAAPYCFGIGCNAFIAEVTWDTDTVSLSSSERTFFSGRNGQIVTVTGITTGGIDGKGSFIFLRKDAYSCYLTLDGETPETLTPSTGSGVIKIQGPATTLYRSKANNPFSWGETVIFGSVQEPKVYAKRIGGGQATAIAVLPGNEVLKVDTKNPNGCFIYNLRLAGSSEFATSRRKISDYSTSAHHSQFVATTSDGQKVIWSFDADSFAILQCDGQQQLPISDNIKELLRLVDTNPDRIQFAHGVYDEYFQLNCLFLPLRGKSNHLDAQGYVASGYAVPYADIQNWTDLGICFHSPSGKWSTTDERDLTASGKIRDNNADSIKTIAGTATGLLGQMLSPTNFAEWCESTVVTFSPITIPYSDFVDSGSTAYDLLNIQSPTIGVVSNAVLEEQFVGTWVIVSDNLREQRIHLRIAAISNSTLGTVDISFDTWMYDISNLTRRLDSEREINLYTFFTTYGPAYTTTSLTTDLRLYFGQSSICWIKLIQTADNIMELKKLDYLLVGLDPSNTFLDLSYHSVNADEIPSSALYSKTVTMNSDRMQFGLPASYSILLRSNFYVDEADGPINIKFILAKIAE